MNIKYITYKVNNIGSKQIINNKFNKNNHCIL